MIRSFAAVLASLVLLLVAPAFAKSKGHAPAVRVTIAPGVTILVPQGWIACDRETNAALGGAWSPAIAKSLNCLPPREGQSQIQMLDPAPLNPMLMIFGHQLYQALDPDILKTATADIASELSAKECKDAPSILLRASESIASCSFAVQTVAQHPALAGTLVVNMPEPRDPTHIARAFLIPYGRESITLQFEMPGKTAPASSPDIDAILQSLTIDPSVEAQAEPQPVSVSPAPGLTLSLPAGWIACDTPTNTLLGAVPGTDAVRQKSCDKIAPAQTLLAFRPVFLLNVSLSVIYEKNAAISQRQIERMDADDLQKFSAAQCPNVSKQVTDANGTVESCTFTTEQVGNHTTLKCVLVATMSGQGPLESEVVQTYYIPYDQGSLTLTLDSPKLTQSYAQPIVDGVVKSVTIQ